MSLNIPYHVWHQHLCLHGKPHFSLPASPGDFSRLAGRSCPGCYKITDFALHSCVCVCVCVCEVLCVPFKSDFSISFSHVELLQLNPTGLQSQMLWGLVQILRLQSLVWGSELSLLWEKLWNIIILHFVDYPPAGYGIWLLWICPSEPSQWSFSFISFAVGNLFW